MKCKHTKKSDCFVDKTRKEAKVFPFPFFFLKRQQIFRHPARISPALPFCRIKKRRNRLAFQIIRLTLSTAHRQNASVCVRRGDAPVHGRGVPLRRRVAPVHGRGELLRRRDAPVHGRSELLRRSVAPVHGFGELLRRRVAPVHGFGELLRQCVAPVHGLGELLRRRCTGAQRVN